MTNSPFLTLLRCITVLYLVNKIKYKRDDLPTIIRDTLKRIDPPKSMMGDASRGEAVENLKDMAAWMLQTLEEEEFDRSDVITRIRLYLQSVPSLIQEVDIMLPMEINEDHVRKRIKTIISELRYDLNSLEIRESIRLANIKINSVNEDSDEVLRILTESLEKHKNAISVGVHKSLVGKLDMSDPTELITVMESAKESVSTEGVMRTGFVGLNRAVGVGGLMRGVLINIGALTHNYKTGMLNDLFRQIPLYNKPWMWDENKKPAIVRISFENKLEQDLPIIYRSLYEQEFNEQIDIRDVDPAKAATYIKERLSVNGYHTFMECYDPNNFNVSDLLDLINGYEAEGYEIHLLVIDYLELIVKLNGQRGDEVINAAFQTVRNHCFPRGITVVTGHQLSTEAQNILRDGANNFTQRMVGGGYYRNTKSLATKLDLEIICHIVEGPDGAKYLSVSRGKHRGGERTPFKHLHFAYKFQEIGGLVDDVNKEEPEVIYNLTSILTSVGGVEDDDWE